MEGGAEKKRKRENKKKKKGFESDGKEEGCHGRSVEISLHLQPFFLWGNAVGIDNRDREGDEEEADVFAGYSFVKTCSP
ncbi:hypothetical protein OIU78_029592 [Salix suchowensis]|nr:hypothetical protein OIU78_029592 [Salix suchowensis]